MKKRMGFYSLVFACLQCIHSYMHETDRATDLQELPSPCAGVNLVGESTGAVPVGHKGVECGFFGCFCSAIF